MKREILFRAKDKETNEWVEGFIMNKNQDMIGFYSNCFEFKFRPCLPETVGQYVGITDKNGKKIFEHDIVKRLYFNHEVVFGEYGKEPHTTIGFFTKENETLFIGEEDDFYYVGINSLHEIEVLGNVFDNPELLNKIEYKGESDNGD